MEFEVIGKRKPRYDGMAHVTGETKFVDDIIVPNTMVVKALRSPFAKGKIRKLDVYKAECLSGVAALNPSSVLKKKIGVRARPARLAREPEAGSTNW